MGKPSGRCVAGALKVSEGDESVSKCSGLLVHPVSVHECLLGPGSGMRQSHRPARAGGLGEGQWTIVTERDGCPSEEPGVLTVLVQDSHHRTLRFLEKVHRGHHI